MQIVDYKLDNNEKLKALRLDIMAYFDLSFNPGSKPQRLINTNCQNCTWKQKKNFVLFPSKTFTREITEPL